MVRLALAALLLAAVPAYADSDHRGAMDNALRCCVHAVMTDALVPAGVMREQAADAALARCFDEIEAVVAAVAAGSLNLNAVRATLRKDLHTYAVLVMSTARLGMTIRIAASRRSVPPRKDQNRCIASRTSSRKLPCSKR